MDSNELISKVVSREEVAELPGKLPRKWFLLEIVDEDENRRAKLLKIVSLAENKDELREYLLDSDPEDKKYIFYFSDPDRECEI